MVTVSQIREAADKVADDYIPDGVDPEEAELIGYRLLEDEEFGTLALCWQQLDILVRYDDEEMDLGQGDAIDDAKANLEAAMEIRSHNIRTEEDA